MELKILFAVGSLLALCSAQPVLSAIARPDAGPADFQRNVAAGTATLDAISRLIAANQTRHKTAVTVADPSRSMFSDVASTDRAYAAMTTLEQHNILIGYPASYFRGKRILTRFEFAVAINRTVQRLQSPGILSPVVSELPAPPEANVAEPPAPTAPLPPQLREDLLLVSTLVQEFDPELRALGLNVREVRKRLDARLNEKGSLKK
jgi:hypothetical protein